jgi:hypothetical protein
MWRSKVGSNTAKQRMTNNDRQWQVKTSKSIPRDFAPTALMCGGSVKAFARAKPIIENMGKRIVQRPRRSKLGDPIRR